MLEILEEPVTVYNFQVADFHTYYVGQNGVLVHNATYDEQVAKIKTNSKQGAEYEKKLKPILTKKQKGLVEQLTIKTESGTKTRVDFAGKTGTKIKLTEAKSSSTAPLTKNQKIAYPEIAQSGGEVVGKGKSGFPGGTKIPPTKVDIMRKK